MSGIFRFQFLLAIFACIFCYAHSATPPLTPNLFENFIRQIRKGVTSVLEDDIKDYTLVSEKINLLVSIDNFNVNEDFPLIGTYEIVKKCNLLRLILFELNSGKFTVIKIFCKDSVLIKSVNGKLELKSYHKVKVVESSSNQSYFSFRASACSDLMTVTNIMDAEDIPNCPESVKSFNKDIIPKGFDPASDQQYVVPIPPINFKGFYKHGAVIVQLDEKNTLTYAVFNSANLNYAIPINKDCTCTVSESILDCKCDVTSYKYYVLEGVMSMGDTKLLTNNVNGKKVLVEDSLEKLESVINDKFEADE